MNTFPEVFSKYTNKQHPADSGRVSFYIYTKHAAYQHTVRIPNPDPLGATPRRRANFSSWGYMFRSGDLALQAMCGGCKSRCLHFHFLTVAREKQTTRVPWKHEKAGASPAAATIFKREVDAGILTGFIRLSPRVQFPPSQPYLPECAPELESRIRL